MSVASALAGDKPFQQLQYSGNSHAKLSHLIGVHVQPAFVQLQLAVCSFNEGIDPAFDSTDQLRLHDHVVFQLGEPFFDCHIPSLWTPNMISVSAIATSAHLYYTSAAS